MHELAPVTYLLALVYLANFFMLSAIAARNAGRSIWLFRQARGGQRLTAVAFQVAFAVALIWPGLRMATGGLISADPIASTIQGWTATLLGHLLVAVGAVVAVLSQYHMSTSWRIGAAEGELGPLIDDGPFGLSRNPVFVGQALLFTGLVLSFPDLIGLASVVVAITAMVVQVRIEEGVLRATFGEDYEAYAARVPRWLGRIRPKASANTRHR